MPELPEVETTRRGIAPLLVNETITKVEIRQPSLRWPIPADMKVRLLNQKLLEIERRGKYLYLNFRQGTAFIHLGMSGSMRVIDTSIKPTKHDHFDLHFSNNKMLRFNDPRRFGAFLWAGTDPSKHKLISHLGPEPLTNAFNAEYLYQLSRRRSLAIKQLIMDSKVVVGVGNIYANEALFKAGIHPNRSANRLSEKRYQGLVKEIKQVLNDAINQGGTTLKDFKQVDGKPGYFSQALNVYGRGGEACVNCLQPLSETRHSGRATVYCRLCQT